MTILKALRNLLEVTKLSNENLVVMKTDCSKEIERMEWKHLEESNASVIIIFVFCAPIWDSTKFGIIFQLEKIRKKQLDVEKKITVAGGYDHTIQWWSDFFNLTDKEELIVNGLNQQQWPKYSLHKSWKIFLFLNFYYVLALHPRSSQSKTSETFCMYGWRRLRWNERTL